MKKVHAEVNELLKSEIDDEEWSQQMRAYSSALDFLYKDLPRVVNFDFYFVIM